DGWAEQDPDDWWRAAAGAIRDCITKARLGGENVACIGLAGQMHGAVLLGDNNQVLRPAIIWCDQRNQEECDWLDQTVGGERVFESVEICARVSDDGARATGLRVGTPAIAGAGDQAGGAIGLGIVRPGDVSATIGTSGVVFAATDSPAMDPQGRAHTFCHAVPDRWHVMGVTQAAGLSLRWFRDLLTGSPNYQKSYQELIAEAAATPAGANGLLWAPYLMGERTPHLDARARGALVGLSASHTRGHVVRAILEGVGFSLK